MEMRSNILSTAVRQKKVWGGDGSFNNNNNNSNNNNNNNNSNNNKRDNFIYKKLLKSYLQLIRLKKRKNYSFKNTIYNFCRFKKHLI